MATFGDIGRAIAGRLHRAGVNPDEARLDAELIVRDHENWDRSAWIVHRDDEAPALLAELIEPAVRRREAREPLAYVRGHAEFWGREFEVTRAVLIPRPETELILEQALALPSPAAARVSDVGTGSGCLAVSLAAERPAWRLHATDISAAALDVARRNARRHGVSASIRFEQAALLGTSGTCDVIVSNPPYVAERERGGLQPEVGFEPAEALFAGPDGLAVIRALVDAAAERLTPGGWLVFEFGFDQKEAIRQLLNDMPAWNDIRFTSDLQGIPRTAAARRGA
ncbi:MAG: peptide chain release factor N(5)-glutamine methyltransferase [Vicinamibacterales bacterium]